nr:unnamed protein product [Callosobruchus chinensis]
MAGPSKRVRYGDDNFEETVLKWYTELDDSASDIDSASEDEYILSEHETASKCSLDDNSDAGSDDENSHPGEKKSFYEKNRFRWSSKEVVPLSRTRKHTLITKVPVVRGRARDLGSSASPAAVWKLLLSEDILQHIIKWSNNKLTRMRVSYKDSNSISHLRDVAMAELKAFVGLLTYTSIFKSNHENFDTIFATDGTGREIYQRKVKCLMKDLFSRNVKDAIYVQERSIA